MLLTLFVTIKGFEQSALLKALARYFEKGRFVGIKLIIGTFILSMFVTNDVALVVMVPLTLLLEIEKRDWIVILEALSANAAALFPYSNPQNLYIYWHYHIDPWTFVQTIAPFSLLFFVAIVGVAALLNPKVYKKRALKVTIKKEAWHFVAFFIVIILTILKILPLFIAALVLLYAIFLYPEALKIDYFLLFTFLLFFGISDNFRSLFAQELASPHHIFLSSVSLSQLISNVPAAIIMADLTSHWQGVLWGVNVGGYGVLWGSLANLIAFKLYIKKYQNRAFLGKFLFLNFLALFYGIALYIFMAS